MGDLLPRSIESHVHLVKRILVALVELPPTGLNALVPPQTGVLLFNLGHAPRLERRICSLVPPLWVTVDLGGILVRQRQGVQRVIDTRSTEVAGLAARGSIVIQLG